MISVDEGVRNLIPKYQKYNIDGFTIRRSIENNIKRGLSTQKAIEITDNALYKAYVLKRG
jgi:hypothetical protein